MSERPRRRPIDIAVTNIHEGFSRLYWFIPAVSVGVVALVGLVFIVMFAGRQSGEPSQWLGAYFLISTIVIFSGVLTALVVNLAGKRMATMTKVATDQEMQQLRSSNRRAKALQQMAATMSGTLSFERVMDVALDVSSLALEEMGVPHQALVGGVFLYDDQKTLVPVAIRRLSERDLEIEINDKQGIVFETTKEVEPLSTSFPGSDPQLMHLPAFRDSREVVCVPLRAGFQIFGFMLLGNDAAVRYSPDHMELFKAVADQAVIALQNAQLFQDLEIEKQNIIEADEEARKELARDLHDGPTQSIAAIAMHINFIRSLLVRDPRQTMAELAKVEKLAKDTAKEIRGMLFALRPLVLESEGLGPAIETMIAKLRETDSLDISFVGGEQGNLLQEQAQGVVFSIIEEALGNIRKHAKATRVSVRFWQEGDLFVARVKDDGVGLDVDAVTANYSSRGSLGLLNMEERASRIDGSLRIESKPGHGTSITLVVPLKKQGAFAEQPLDA